jgi:hypothetical protein
MPTPTPTPVWNPMQCKGWLLKRGLQKGTVEEIRKASAINDKNALLAKPGLQRRFSVDGSNMSVDPKTGARRPVAFKLENLPGKSEPEPVCSPEFEKILTKFTGINPNDCKLKKDERLGVQACDLLNQLGKYVEGTNPGVKWILGPIKGLGRMAQKAAQAVDYDFDCSKLKDSFRGSIACPDRQFEGVLRTLDEVIKPAYGMTLKEPKKDKFQQLPKFMGYGDVTYFIVFRELAVSCELQVHKLGMLFGKMSHENWDKDGLDALMNYRSKEQELGIEGGLGHCILEVATRGGFSVDAVRVATVLSPLYYTACNVKSGPAPNKTMLTALIKEFKEHQAAHVVVRTNP